MRRYASLVTAALLIAAACTSGGTGGPPTPAGGGTSATPGQTAGGSPGETAGGSPGETGGATGVVNLLAAISDDPEVEQRLQAQVEAFNESHPGLEVRREALENDQLRQVIQTRLSSGSVDVFGYDTGPGFGGVLARAGLLYDLGPAYEQYDWQIFDWAKARCTYGGVVSCVPGQVEEVGIFYNKTLFDEKGFAEPQTLEEFRQIMDAFKADGITPLAFGNQPQWPAGHQFSMTLSNIVGREGLDAKLYGDSPWNDEDTVKAIDIYFRDFQEAGYFPEDPNAISYEDANALFYSGEAAMVPTGTWLVAEIDQSVDFETGFFPFPSIDGSGISPPAGLGGGVFVNRNAQNPEGALEWLNWLNTDEVVREWGLEQFNTIPAQPIQTEGLEVSPLFQEVLDDLAESSGETDAFGYNIDVLTPQNFNEQMFTGFQEVLNGTLTPQEQADALEAAYNEAEEAGETLERP